MFEKRLLLCGIYGRLQKQTYVLGGDKMVIQENLGIQEKLKILTGAARYDAACTSSGVRRKGKAGSLGSTSEAGIWHSFTADGRCISLLKILFTNQCIYDCKYCINRSSNDVVRTSFTPEEVCQLTMEFYRRNFIEGLFLSSGILHNANHTMELIYETLHKLRNQWNFNGYIHVKAIPGADGELVERMGFLADRMSVNLELPTAEGLKTLAPGKTRDTILKPMRQIQRGISASSHLLGYHREIKNSYAPYRSGFPEGSALIEPEIKERSGPSPFVPAGQSTQMIVGATPENDYQMMSVSQALYRNYGLKRVFYSAYIPVNEDSSLPAPGGPPPLLREHRLYQADWLLRFYGFQVEELLSENQPNFNVFLDPKCDWALRHLGEFPVEVSLAPYQQLLRVPGMGVKSAMRIVTARRRGSLTFEDLKRLGVVMKRARYFITCSGRSMEGFRLDQDYITNCLLGDERRTAWDIEHQNSFRQLSLFDDMHLAMPVTREDRYGAVVGNL